MLTEHEKKELDERGYVILPDFMGPELLEALRRRVDELYAEEGERSGSEFKQEPQARRLANLVNKGEIFGRMILTPEVLQRVGYVLGPEFKLSSLNARTGNPHSDAGQPLHTDSGAVPDEKGCWVSNSVWMLDDFTLRPGQLDDLDATDGKYLYFKWDESQGDVWAMDVETARGENQP